MREGISAEAFLLFDPSLNPVFVSRLAVEVRFIPNWVLVTFVTPLYYFTKIL
jgi:hypothetical protein